MNPFKLLQTIEIRVSHLKHFQSLEHCHPKVQGRLFIFFDFVFVDIYLLDKVLLRSENWVNSSNCELVALKVNSFKILEVEHKFGHWLVFYSIPFYLKGFQRFISRTVFTKIEKPKVRYIIFLHFQNSEVAEILIAQNLKSFVTNLTLV